ncbi:hypothetical protein ELH72_10220 [Rhizobium ruizarguesonis]|uniref:hypothetical protein n=1 Tax=Rhizobium ruizarguesonis TaxID=2081791 RepID=UPI0010324EE3|nr:hypothetical protein [Rhizobium ruizarguesonis]TAZ83587.1 hypothetical protein ELH72_10220 [Rhizobium ruizarguesonis]
MSANFANYRPARKLGVSRLLPNQAAPQYSADMATKFLYMDEQYIDPDTHRNGERSGRKKFVSLTGLLIPTDVHKTFRSRYYKAVGKALDVLNGFPELPVIHASKLFPDHSDDVKYQFLEEVVQICADLDFRVIRVGYYATPQLISVFNFNNPQKILNLCFSSMLHCIEDELTQNEIWPVMETDNSSHQDRIFAGLIQATDYISAVIGTGPLSINNENLGELHYSTKRSAYGTVTDCISYLLDAGSSVASLGAIASPFKQKLAEIAANLVPLTAFNEIIEMKFEIPPRGYIAKGPLRYAFPIATDGGQ